MVKHKSNNVVLAEAQRSAGTGSSTYINASSYKYAAVVIYITAKSGAPTLRTWLETSPVDPAIDNYKWSLVYEEPLITNTMIGTSFPKNFRGHFQTDFSGWLRISYEVAGASTPKLTFSANIEIK